MSKEIKVKWKTEIPQSFLNLICPKHFASSDVAKIPRMCRTCYSFDTFFM